MTEGAPLLSADGIELVIFVDERKRKKELNLKDNTSKKRLLLFLGLFLCRGLFRRRLRIGLFRGRFCRRRLCRRFLRDRLFRGLLRREVQGVELIPRRRRGGVRFGFRLLRVAGTRRVIEVRAAHRADALAVRGTVEAGREGEKKFLAHVVREVDFQIADLLEMEAQVLDGDRDADVVETVASGTDALPVTIRSAPAMTADRWYVMSLAGASGGSASGGSSRISADSVPSSRYGVSGRICDVLMMIMILLAPFCCGWRRRLPGARTRKWSRRRMRSRG